MSILEFFVNKLSEPLLTLPNVGETRELMDHETSHQEIWTYIFTQNLKALCYVLHLYGCGLVVVSGGYDDEVKVDSGGLSGRSMRKKMISNGGFTVKHKRKLQKNYKISNPTGYTYSILSEYFISVVVKTSCTSA